MKSTETGTDLTKAKITTSKRQRPTDSGEEEQKNKNQKVIAAEEDDELLPYDEPIAVSPTTLPTPNTATRPTTSEPRHTSEERALMRVLRDHPELDVPDRRDFSPDPQSLMAITLLTNANSTEPFELRTYRQATESGHSIQRVQDDSFR